MSRSRRRIYQLPFIFFVMVLLAACSNEVIDADGIDICKPGDTYDVDSGECILSGDDTNNDNNNIEPDINSTSNNASPNNDDPQPNNNVDNNNSTEQPTDSNHTCTTDADGDGYIAVECGGDDCDDNDPAINPGINEFCSFSDNDCSGEINDELDCSFYAHTPNDLYRIDPFKLTLEHIMEVPPNLNDIDTHPDGTLYGVTSHALYRYYTNGRGWVKMTDFDYEVHATGMCIDSSGKAFMTADFDLYEVDLDNGNIFEIGDIGHRSSGDCVVTKGDILFMSARHVTDDEAPDNLVLINGQTGVGTTVGGIEYDRVYGLTAAWGFLFGLTTAGELISIAQNGEGTLLSEFPGVRWYGAASTPGR